MDSGGLLSSMHGAVTCRCRTSRPSPHMEDGKWVSLSVQFIPLIDLESHVFIKSPGAGILLIYADLCDGKIPDHESDHCLANSPIPEIR